MQKAAYVAFDQGSDVIMERIPLDNQSKELKALLDKALAIYNEEELMAPQFKLFNAFLTKLKSEVDEKISPDIFTSSLHRLEHQVSRSLVRVLHFHAVNCMGDVQISKEILEDFEENSKKISIDSRKALYRILKECRTIFYIKKLKKSLKKLMVDVITLCDQFKKHVEEFHLFSASMMCKASLEKINYSGKYEYRLHMNVVELFKLKGELEEADEMSVEDLHNNYESIMTMMSDKVTRDTTLQVYIDMLQQLLLKYTFLPLISQQGIQLSRETHGSRRARKAKINLLLGRKKVFVNTIKAKHLSKLTITAASGFIYLLEVLARANNDGLLPLLGVIVTDKSTSLVFEGFEANLDRVISTFQTRDIKDCLTVFYGTLKGLSQLSDGYMPHGEVIPKNIFLQSGANGLKVKLGYEDIFQSYTEFISRSGSTESFLKKEWTDVIHAAPEQFMFKNSIHSMDRKQIQMKVYCTRTDIYSLAITLYLFSTPLFASDLSSEASRREAMKSFKQPYSYAVAMSKMTLETDKKSNMQSYLTKNLIDLVCEHNNRPDLPSRLDNRNKDLFQGIVQLLFCIKSCWSNFQYERPDAKRLIAWLDHYESMVGPLNVVDYENFSLALGSLQMSSFKDRSLSVLDVEKL